MRKALVSLVLLGSLLAPSLADAALPNNVFGGTVPCATQNAPAAVAGQVWCSGSPSTVPSFDGTPIDVAFYAPGGTGNYPVIGVYHGYGGVKYGPGSTDVQRWITRGYAVFTMTDRGFRASCGVGGGAGSPACAKGYVHLLSNKFEVRDAQFLQGLLADDNAIAPKQIGAVGQSYGGGMSAQLGALKNRVQLGAGSCVTPTTPACAVTAETNNQLVPWKSPGGKDMEIAATAPEFGWSNLAYSLVPNGSTLDYAAQNPYRGPAGQTRRAGVEKAAWVDTLYGGGAQPGAGNANGFYCGFIGACTEPLYDLPGIRNGLTGNAALGNTATPSPLYDGNTFIQNALDELSSSNSAYGTNDTVAPAPALLSNGWNDDLFPVDEAVRYYNKIRDTYPTAPINLWAFDWGHPTRTAINTDNAISLFAAEGRWMDFYVRGIGTAPEDATGGVNTISSGCTTETSAGLPTSSAIVHAANWASLSKGELAVTDTSAAGKAITATATSLAPFQSFPTNGAAPTVCTTAADTDIGGLAYYTIPAQGGDYTIAGSPTISLDLTTGNANDALLARLYDVNVGAGNRRLIARGALRPYGAAAATGGGTSTQVFQLHPQQWRVAAGHTLKLELLAQDSPYIRQTAGQSNLTVKNLELRVPTLDAPAGSIRTPATKVLPTGYTLARDLRQAGPAGPTGPTGATGPTGSYNVPPPYYTPPAGTKKKAGLTLKVKPKTDKRKPFKFTATGKLNRKGAAKAAACKGKVKITVKKGGKTLDKAVATVKKSCTYKAKLKLSKKAGKRGKAVVQAKFGGNSVLKASKKVKQSVKYGKKKSKKGKGKK